MPPLKPLIVRGACRREGVTRAELWERRSEVPPLTLAAVNENGMTTGTSAPWLGPTESGAPDEVVDDSFDAAFALENFSLQ